MENTPFLPLIKELTGVGSSYLLTPLILLHVQYRAMLEFHQDFQRKRNQPGYREDPLESLFIKNKYVLDYNAFISTLNQLGRILDEKYSPKISIPQYNRIRFYRNEVVEHWDKIVEASEKGEFSVIYPSLNEGNPIIFILIEREGTKRQLLKDQINIFFQGKGFQIIRDDMEVWRDQSEVEKLYCALETSFQKLDTRMDKSLKSLVGLLFKFGLPGPIDNIEKYSEKLVKELKSSSIF